MKIFIAFLLGGLAMICYFPSSHTVFLFSPSVSQLIKNKVNTLIKKASFRQLPLEETVLKFYQLEMNSEFWSRYENLTRHCLKINSFWSAVNQITIACLQPTF